MGLSSVLSTSISGLQAAETTISVDGNNVANSQTVGFKSSTVSFASQFLQTLSLGAAPTDTTGGTDPRQIGLGVQVASINPDFTQGTIQISSSPSDLAIQGNGFFTVKSQTGENLYTRNGKFALNANQTLVDSNGNQLLGFGVDQNFNIQSTTLQTLTIPLGASAVAKPTQNVTLQGTLSPTGDLATTAGIIQTGALGDAAYTAPAGATIALAATPIATTITGTPATTGTGGVTSSATYSYKVVFADGPLTPAPAGTESVASTSIGPITTGATDDQITLNNIPTDANNVYKTRRIYRTDANGSTYKLVGEITNNTATSYTDNKADASLGAALNTNTLNGNYTYYVTYANAIGGPGTGIESRPTPLVGPVNVVNGRVQFSSLPVDTSGQWSTRRIYRSSATDPTNLRFVAEVPNNLAGQTYTDSSSDAQIASNSKLDFVGPRATSNTLVKNLLTQTSTGSTPLFQAGTLAFTGQKGLRTLATKNLNITNTTTTLELVTFVTQALGIHTSPGPDPTNPIPADSSGLSAGGFVTANGEIKLVGNNGVDNSIGIGLSAFQLTPASNPSGGAQQINLTFGSVQTAVGNTAVSDFVAYDSLGIPLKVRVTADLESRTSTQTVYRWYADASNNDPASGVDIGVGSGLIRFDGQGRFISASNSTVTVQRANVPSSKPAAFNLDFSKVSGLSATTSSLAATQQDGFPPGKLTSYIVGEDGVISGVFDNGTQRNLGQIRLARFSNPQGLSQRGNNLYAPGVNSGLPVDSNPAQNGTGSIVAGALELSNVDIGKSLISLISASTQYQGNARVITAANQLFQDLLQIGR